MFMFAKYNFVEIERVNKKVQILNTRSGLILPSDKGENTHNKAVPLSADYIYCNQNGLRTPIFNRACII